jgi:hypothetical protein
MQEGLMRSRIVLSTLVGTLCLVTGCQDPTSVSQPTDTPSFAQTPATGNGHKFVLPIDEDGDPVNCGAGAVLDVHFGGWIQFRVFDEPIKRNVELDVFHVVSTFTNTAGETYVFRDVGPDHYYLEDGNLIVASSGRLGGGLIGHIVTNLTTGETEFIAGKEFAGAEALACAALT